MSRMPQGAHRRLAGHAAPVLCCALQADGHTVLSGGEDGTVCVFDLRQGAAVHRIGLARGGEAMPSLAVHPGEPHTACAACGRAVQVLDLRQVCGGPPRGGQAKASWLQGSAVLTAGGVQDASRLAAVGSPSCKRSRQTPRR